MVNKKTIQNKTRMNFELFKSSVCHEVKNSGDKNFLIDVLSSDRIREYYKKELYAECFYLLAMVDYLSKENDVPICTNYNDIRCRKLQEMIYPLDVILLDRLDKSDMYRQKSLKAAIPEFLKYNIVESDIRNVC